MRNSDETGHKASIGYVGLRNWKSWLPNSLYDVEAFYGVDLLCVCRGPVPRESSPMSAGPFLSMHFRNHQTPQCPLNLEL